MNKPTTNQPTNTMPRTKTTKPSRALIVRTIEATISKHNGRPFKLDPSTIYTPRQWRDRGEEYGLTSLLVITHDGGDHAPFFSWDYCYYVPLDAMVKALAEIGAYSEQCTCWYSAIYTL